MTATPLPIRSVKAVRDNAMRARVVKRLPLHYRTGADTRLDRPAHVRAASSLAWWRKRLVVVQDDANFVALVNPFTGDVEAVALPADAQGRRLFDSERGNKADKHDFEALWATKLRDGSDALVAFGSGSTRRRESIAVIRASVQ
jgi:hypothetical protein